MTVRGNLFDLAKPRRKRDQTELTLLEQIHTAQLPEPIEEYAFASVIGRNWRFDLAWPPYRLAVEIEGAMFGGRVINVQEGFEYRTLRGQKVHVPIAPNTVVRLGGGHNTGERLKRDLEKRMYAAILGWAVLPLMPDHVRDQEAIPLIVLALQQRGVKVSAPPRMEVGF